MLCIGLKIRPPVRTGRVKLGSNPGGMTKIIKNSISIRKIRQEKLMSID
jgi:hypothetical protein